MNKAPSVLDSLSPIQKEAATHLNGPIVVFAGAGSGKTRIITSRIAYLISQGVDPWKILAVTFTNKAAQEMKDRVISVCERGKYSLITTFHSACARWLREFAEELGFDSNFSIYDESDSDSALKTLLKDTLRQTITADIFTDIKKFIHKMKMLGFVPSDQEKIEHHMGNKIPFLGMEMYQKYQNYLLNCNAMDFGDLILNMLLLLRRNKKVIDIMQSRYEYVLVDEYQDTNHSQIELIKHICGKHSNLFVVGDDDQSIYSWRGAVSRNILDFTKLYPNVKQITMEQNYRSTANIVNAASEMIQNNIIRAEKKLFSDINGGELIDYKEEADDEFEAKGIIETIEQEKNTYPYHDVAIFFRTNAQSRLIEDELRLNNIPYRIYGSLRFYDRAEVKEIIAYLRLCVNENDDSSLKRIINTPTRGIGNKTVETILAKSILTGQSMMNVMKDMVSSSGNNATTRKISVFLSIFERIKEFVSKNQSISKSIEDIIDLTNYADYLKQKFTIQFLDKMENLHELVASVTRWQTRYEEATLASWLQSISLLGDENKESETNCVSLMTLHAAKGLEFRRVYIAGVEEGLIPHAISSNFQEQLEEERRLLYVGMTRAREKLSLYSAHRRFSYKNYTSNEPSRFLYEIPEKYLNKPKTINPYIVEESDPSGVYYDFEDLSYGYDQSNEMSYEEPEYNFEIGSSVFHLTYGKGNIEKIEANLNKRKQKAVVNFSEFGPKRVLISHLTPFTKPFT